jgi:hypothetical protein
MLHLANSEAVTLTANELNMAIILEKLIVAQLLKVPAFLETDVSLPTQFHDLIAVIVRIPVFWVDAMQSGVKLRMFL